MHKKNNKGTKSERVFSSNAIRLSARELLVTAVIAIGIVFFVIPILWRGAENLEMSDNFRLAYDYRDDYWVYEKCVDEAMKKYPVVFIGDSVIWGMYVDNQHTLPAIINRKLHQQVAANLAIDGLHSVAMDGLIRYYGSAIKNKTVFIYLNPLWMNSKKYDLSDEEEMDVHHPRLVSQFSPKLKCYQEPLSTRMSVLLERNLPFYSLLNHIRLSFFDNEDLAQWVIDNPYDNPVSKISFKLDLIEKEHNNSSQDWSEKGITKQDWNWVKLDESTQWAAFSDTLKLLKSRNNKVCVMIGSINPYILTKTSLKKYDELNQAIIKQLKADNVEYVAMPKLPSDYYADASHPLGKGYEIMADTILKTELMKKYQSKLTSVYNNNKLVTKKRNKKHDQVQKSMVDCSGNSCINL
jgi:lysophospholipase L1-like esterase